MRKPLLKQPSKRQQGDDLDLPQWVDAPVADPRRFLSFLSSAGVVRLLRAYHRIKVPEVRQALVETAEKAVAEYSDGRALPTFRPLPPIANSNTRQSGVRTRRSRLTALAKHTFGDDQFALRWLELPNPALKNRIPIELAKTELGAKEVEVILTRIAHGVYS